MLFNLRHFPDQCRKAGGLWPPSSGELFMDGSSSKHQAPYLNLLGCKARFLIHIFKLDVEQTSGLAYIHCIPSWATLTWKKVRRPPLRGTQFENVLMVVFWKLAVIASHLSADTFVFRGSMMLVIFKTSKTKLFVIPVFYTQSDRDCKCKHPKWKLMKVECKVKMKIPSYHC